MTLSTRIILHALLEECPREERDRLLGCLSRSEKEALTSLPRSLGNPLKSQEEPGKLLDWIHPSWITPFLRTLPEKDIGLFLAALSAEKMALVGKDLLFGGKIPPLSSLGKIFIQNTLVRYLTAEMDDLLPIECLPASPLNDLMILSSEAIGQFLDLLGLHDLAFETKQIIDKHKLLKIDEALSAAQMSYFKILLQSHEPVAFTQMGLMNWQGEKEKLKMLVRQRGANRLAKALHHQDPSFCWYILHRVDMEKALLIRKLCTPIDNPRAEQLLIQQMVELIHYIQGSFHE